MKTLIWALLSPCLADWPAAAFEEDFGSCLLQADARRRDFPPGGFQVEVDRERGICTNLTALDFYQPIDEVKSRLKEEGWCIFGQTGTWASECAVANQKRDVRPFALQFYKGWLTLGDIQDARRARILGSNILNLWI